MQQIKWTDPEGIRAEHRDVVRFIERYAESVPDTTFKVHVCPEAPLEWSMIVTSVRGRMHVNVNQRVPNGSIRFSFD